jgi:hypothetical protein
VGGSDSERSEESESEDELDLRYLSAEQLRRIRTEAS